MTTLGTKFFFLMLLHELRMITRSCQQEREREGGREGERGRKRGREREEEREREGGREGERGREGGREGERGREEEDEIEATSATLSVNEKMNIVICNGCSLTR